MLQARDINRQRKLEQERYDRELVDKSLARNLEERRLTERAQEAERGRLMKIVEAESTAASLRGRGSPPGGYHDAALDEIARVAFESGQVQRENMAYERGVKQNEMALKARDQDLDWKSSTLGHIAGIEKSGHSMLTDYGRNEYMPALADPYAPIPEVGGPISRRLTPDEYQSRRQTREQVDHERLKHFDKMEAYLNQAASGKEEWAAFAKAGQLRKLAQELREYAALGASLPEALEGVKKRYGYEGRSLVDYAAGLMSDEIAPALGKTPGPRSAAPIPDSGAGFGSPDDDL